MNTLGNIPLFSRSLFVSYTLHPTISWGIGSQVLEMPELPNDT